MQASVFPLKTLVRDRRGVLKSGASSPKKGGNERSEARSHRRCARFPRRLRHRAEKPAPKPIAAPPPPPPPPPPSSCPAPPPITKVEPKPEAKPGRSPGEEARSREPRVDRALRIRQCSPRMHEEARHEVVAKLREVRYVIVQAPIASAPMSTTSAYPRSAPTNARLSRIEGYGRVQDRGGRPSARPR